ncbi:MAG: hypothetical protein IKE65_09175 [Clostridia bacterium]|nr:hypothetical protein [Clostridia bacterium]
MKKKITKALALLLCAVMLMTALPVSVKAADVPSTPEKGIPLVIVRIDESDESVAEIDIASSLPHLAM